MKKKLWMSLLGMLLLTVSLVPAATASAAEGATPDLAAQRPRLDGLALIAPVRAPLNADVTMNVIQRNDMSRVEGAGIWALTPDKADALKAEILSNQSVDEAVPQQPDWETLLNSYGTFLGRTDTAGKLTYSFTEEGRYVLVTAKDGYLPGRTNIGVKAIPSKLTVQTVKRALVDEDIRINVAEQYTGNPVADAGVWSFTRDAADTLKQEMDALRESSGGQVNAADAEALIQLYGEFIGTTNNDGTLAYAFSEEGGYMLVAVKTDYMTGRTVVRVVAEADAGIDASTTMFSGRASRIGNAANITPSRANLY